MSCIRRGSSVDVTKTDLATARVQADAWLSPAGNPPALVLSPTGPTDEGCSPG